VPRDGAAPVLATRPLARDAGDARRHARRTVALTLVLYATLAAALVGMLPAWCLALLLPPLYVRLSLSLHELMHARTAAEVSWFHRLAMIFDTPLGLGYREHRATHLRHHRYAAGPRDPELYQIRGSALRAFVNACASPERAALRWVRERGLDASLCRHAALRGVVFVALSAAAPQVFAVYWLTLRGCIGCSAFLFHHVLHNRGGRLGTYGLPSRPRLLRRALQAVCGAEPLVILDEHPTHHAQPWVRASDLPAARRRAGRMAQRRQSPKPVREPLLQRVPALSPRVRQRVPRPVRPFTCCSTASAIGPTAETAARNSSAVQPNFSVQ
jgi:hypothetical protein